MIPKVTKIEANTPIARLKRVAAYARVSCSKEAMLHSLEAQVSQYSRLIQSHNGWQYMGVYADEAITGTKESRAEFQRLLTDCRAGKIDMILTKSISRFARNTVTTLSAIRELKALGVDVYFEEQNIHSISADGELRITIMASFAQEESRSVSEICKWTIRNKFQKGEPTFFRCYGYKWVNGQLEIVPEQAEVVRMIFRDYLDGMGEHAIINKLNDLGIPSRDGCKWNLFSIRTVLHNERYIGDLLLQKSYVVDHLSKKQRKNTGELPQYYVTDAHEPIVPRELFDAVQAEFSRRAAYYSQKNGSAHGNRFPFTGMIVCGICGCSYRRKITKAGTKYAKPVWICHTFNSKGKHACASKQIPEVKLYEAACTALEMAEFDEDAFGYQIDHIEVTGPNSLRFITKQGDARDIDWQDASRADSWTPEMKAQAAGYARKGR